MKAVLLLSMLVIIPLLFACNLVNVDNSGDSDSGGNSGGSTAADTSLNVENSSGAFNGNWRLISYSEKWYMSFL